MGVGETFDFPLVSPLSVLVLVILINPINSYRILKFDASLILIPLLVDLKLLSDI